MSIHSSSSGPKRRRVPAMAPEDRRAALIETTVGLLREHGMAVSTRQIADAAGVAEGTIFGVFPDKASLLQAAVISAFEPDQLMGALAAIPPGDDLRVRLRAVVELLWQIFTANEQIIAATRSAARGTGDPRDFFDRVQQARRRILRGVAAVIEPDRALLRRDPDSTARLLLTLVVAGVHRGFGDRGALTGDTDSDEIVSVLLDGLLVRPAAVLDISDTPGAAVPGTGATPQTADAPRTAATAGTAPPGDATAPGASAVPGASADPGIAPVHGGAAIPGAAATPALPSPPAATSAAPLH